MSYHVDCFFDAVGHWLFAIDVFARVQCIDCLAGVPMIGSGNHDGVDRVVVDDFAIVAAYLWLLAHALLDFRRGLIAITVEDVANGGRFYVPFIILQTHRRIDVLLAAPTATGRNIANANESYSQATICRRSRPS